MVYINNTNVTWDWHFLDAPIVARMIFIYRLIDNKWCLFELHSLTLPDITYDFVVGKKDSHGCGGGSTWCESMEKCVKSWELSDNELNKRMIDKSIPIDGFATGTGGPALD